MLSLGKQAATVTSLKHEGTARTTTIITIAYSVASTGTALSSHYSATEGTLSQVLTLSFTSFTGWTDPMLFASPSHLVYSGCLTWLPAC